MASANDNRTTTLLLAGAAVVACVGFFSGTRNAAAPLGYAAVTTHDRGGVVAPTQAGMEAERYAGRQAAQRAALEEMRLPEAPQEGAAAPHDPAAYAAAVAARRASRAYDGAPPTIPHGVDQHGAPACLVCHAEGLRVRELSAPIMSHTQLESCLQCHALGASPLPRREPLAPSVSEVNAFVGLTEPERGSRAWPGAPPTMPHRSFMRERCESCHGAQAGGLSTSHPWRQSCPQCHAPSATLDQRPRATRAPLTGLSVTSGRTR